MDGLRQSILNISRIQNLSLSTDGFNKLLEFLSTLQEPQEALREIFRHLSNDADGLITSPLIESAILKVQKLSSSEIHENENDFFEVQTAFDVPHVSYDPSIKKFNVSTERPPLLGEVKAKRDVFVQQYYSIYQRIMRHPSFRKPLLSQSSSTPYFEIIPITSLLGSTGRRYLFGILREDEEGGIVPPGGRNADVHYLLEDLTGSIKLSFAQTSFVDEGFFCEGSFVILEGELAGDTRAARGRREEEMDEDAAVPVEAAPSAPSSTQRVFSVRALYLPPSEPRTASLAADPALARAWRCRHTEREDERRGERERERERDTSPLDVLEEQKLIELRQQSESFIVVLSDVFLDMPRVMDKLKVLFSGFNESEPHPPQYFVMMGNFTSQQTPATTEEQEHQRRQWNYLAQLIASFPRIADYSTFLFIPGPHDYVPNASLLPKRPLFSFIFDSFKRNGIHFINGTNPSRLTIYDQTLLFFRDDLTSKMRRICSASSSLVTDVLSPSILFTQSSQQPLTTSSNSSSTTTSSSHSDETATTPSDASSIKDATISNAVELAHKLTDLKKQQEFTTAQYMVNTITSQASLSPLPPLIQPFFWGAADSLRVYPLPHSLIIGDNWPIYHLDVHGTYCVNPGSFSKTFQFIVFYTASGTWEESQIPA